MLMHKQRRKDFRRLKSTQDLENTNPDFQNRVLILFEAYTEKGSSQ